MFAVLININKFLPKEMEKLKLLKKIATIVGMK